MYLGVEFFAHSTPLALEMSPDGLRNYFCWMSLLSRIIFMTSSSTLFCEFLFWRHSYVLIIFVTTTICSTALKYICVPVGGESLEAWIPDLSPSNPSSPRARTFLWTLWTPDSHPDGYLNCEEVKPRKDIHLLFKGRNPLADFSVDSHNSC